ncbi:MAG: hypothetical protein JXQ67_00095 [Campylobacterales bacterium]|nr:hypothetical protein [Campylobacterales bacterium]
MMGTIAAMKRFLKAITLPALKHRVLLGLLLASFFFVTIHSYIHNNFNHKHDSSCSVYVLEELINSDEVVYFVVALSLFLPFYFVLYYEKVFFQVLQRSFAIRAPPHFPSY